MITAISLILPLQLIDEQRGEGRAGSAGGRCDHKGYIEVAPFLDLAHDHIAIFHKGLLAHISIGSDAMQIGDMKPILGRGEAQLFEIINRGVYGQGLHSTGKFGTQIVFGQLGGPTASKGFLVHRIQYPIAALAYAEHEYVKHDILSL